MVRQDDVYNGYFIPKCTLVIANVWYVFVMHWLELSAHFLGTFQRAMNRDPVLFPDFDEFRPERFLDESGQVDKVPPDTHHQG